MIVARIAPKGLHYKSGWCKSSPINHFCGNFKIPLLSVYCSRIVSYSQGHNPGSPSNINCLSRVVPLNFRTHLFKNASQCNGTSLEDKELFSNGNYRCSALFFSL